MREPSSIFVQFPPGVATMRDRHWHAPSNLDLERDLNTLYPMDASDDLVGDAELVALELGGFVVSVAYPEDTVLRVALPDAPEGLTQDELNDLGTAQLVDAVKADAAAFTLEEPAQAEEIVAE